jgi:hypothetical protein
MKPHTPLVTESYEMGQLNKKAPLTSSRRGGDQRDHDGAARIIIWSAHSTIPKLRGLLWRSRLLRPYFLRPYFGGFGIHLVRSFGKLAL